MTTAAESKSLLASVDPEDRRRGVALLEGATSGERAQILVSAMADTDWRVRKEAVRVAIALVPASDVLAQLLNPFTESEHVGQRNAVVEALALYGPNAVRALELRLPSFDADARKLAAEVLGRCRERSALGVLAGLCEDADKNVQLAAIEAITWLGAVDQEAALSLLQAILSREDPLLRLAVLSGMGQLGVAPPFELLEGLLQDPILRSTVVASLGRTFDIRALPVLMKEFESAHGASRQAALLALAELARVEPTVQHSIRRTLASRSDLVDLIASYVPDRGGDVALRKAAIYLCGVSGSGAAANVAVAQLTDINVAEEAESALVMLGELGILAVLRVIQTAQPENLEALLEFLSRMPPVRELEAEVSRTLLRVLEAGENDPLRAALAAAAMHGGESLISALLPWLGPEVRVTVRRGALVALAELARRFPETARRIAKGAGSQSLAWPAVVAALGAPLEEQAEADVAHLKQLLASDDKTTRRAAVEALAVLRASSAIEVLALALTDEEREVQIAALGALGSVRGDDGSAEGAEHLINLIERVDEDVLLVPAIHALGKTNDDRALIVLRSLVSSKQPLRALAAIEAVSVLGEAARNDALIDALSHPASDVVKLALEALLTGLGEAGLPHLESCLRHPAWDVRRFAAELSTRIPGVNIEFVRTCLLEEQIPQVSAALQRALAEIETRSSVRRSRVPSTAREPS